LKVHSILRGSALIAFVLLTSSLIFSARTLSAETLSTQTQTQQLDVPSKGTLGEIIAIEEAYVVPPTPYVATAYSLRGRTASGRPVSKGLIAADPRHLPLGSRVRIEAGTYSGEYLVADTGSLVRGRRIDIWTPTSREAMRFGRRVVKLTVLSLGRKR
jgi:3D (Asp-Asp-Asp) domain-containing protein